MLLVAIKSCLADLDRGCHDVIRSTWGADLRGKALLRFFVGAETDGRTSRTYKSDEVVVDAANDYHSLPFKTRAICQWALGKNITNTFLCDNDTYVNVPRLLTPEYLRYDYVGKISKPLGETFPYDAPNRNGEVEHIENCYPWASGGFGYFLSKDAANDIADKFPLGWAEDLWVGQVLGPEIAKGNLMALDVPANTYSMHYPSHVFKKSYDPADKWMETVHATHS
jgi:hypothetical protein